MASGVDYFRLAKMSHKGFCLSTLENLMEGWPGGSYTVMKITPIFTGVITLLSIGYKYNYRKVLGFISAEGDGSTEPGDPYLSCFLDIFSNVYVCPS